jgi:hypothetical protein
LLLPQNPLKAVFVVRNVGYGIIRVTFVIEKLGKYHALMAVSPLKASRSHKGESACASRAPLAAAAERSAFAPAAA